MRHAKALSARFIQQAFHLDAIASQAILGERGSRQQFEQGVALYRRPEGKVGPARRRCQHRYTDTRAVLFQGQRALAIRGLANHHGGARRGRHGDRPDDLRAQTRQQRLGNVRHQRFVIETVGECANHDGGPVTIVVRIALDITRQSKSFQNTVSRGPRKIDGTRQCVDGGAIEPIQFGENLQSAIQRAYRSRRFACAFLRYDVCEWVGSRANLCVHDPFYP